MFARILRLFQGKAASDPVPFDPVAMRREHDSFLIAGDTIDAAKAIVAHPPLVDHAKKRRLFDLALARRESGDVSVRRFRDMPLPDVIRFCSPESRVEARRGFFRYDERDDADHWHMNFAHHDLFHAYGQFPFAQDEIQVAEHPILASLRERMGKRTDGLRPKTVEGGKPTPVLVRGAPRTIAIDTRAIYGARFTRADEATIIAAVKPLAPITRSNILAIEAPIPCGGGLYDRREILGALVTAYSGFRAVAIASIVDLSPPKPVVLHTGNWGCGAYGGNRKLMLSIQIIAARLAGIGTIVFHCGADDPDDVASFDRALRTQFRFQPGEKMAMVVDRLANAEFRWGASDGN